MKNDTRILVFKVMGLKRITTRKALEASIREAHSGELREVEPGSRIVVLKGELGFMAVDYFVGIYEPRPLPLRRDRLKLVNKFEFEDRERPYAEKIFENLTTVVAPAGKGQ